MKIGLLGGSFNPAHQGHLHISELALQKLGLNQVWWIPTAQNPLKKTATVPYVERLNHCLELIKNHPKIKVRDFEKYSIFTYDLVKKIKAQYPEVRFYWIMGADNLANFHLWKNFLPLIKSIEIAIFSRADFLRKAKETQAFQIYQKIAESRKCFAENDFVANNYLAENSAGSGFVEDFAEEDNGFAQKNLIGFNSDLSLAKKSINKNLGARFSKKLPKFSFFYTKNYNISSSEIRNKKL